MLRFKDDANRIKEDAKNSALKILVWGPGNPGPSAEKNKKAAYEKRKQIKDVLRKEFPRSEVYFSEDKEMKAISGDMIGQLEKEALQSAVADVIIMLDVGRGVDLELDHFVLTYPWFRDKVIVFLPAEYVSSKGLVSEVFKYINTNQVEGFTKAEFDRCDVAKIKAVKAVQSIAIILLLRRMK